MKLTRLFRFRVLDMGRRLTGGGFITGMVAVVLVLAGAWVLTQGLVSWAFSPLSTASDPIATARDRGFWLNALQVLVFSYTTFEVIFRAPDTVFVSRLPLKAETRWIDLLTRAWVAHAPLMAPSLAFGWSLQGLQIGEQTLTSTGDAVIALTLATWIAGIPLCCWIHLLAGRALLGDPSHLDSYLAGGVVTDEAARLLYAPGQGLAATLGLALVADRYLATSPSLLFLIAAAGALGIFCSVRSIREAGRVLHRVVPRFAEVDVPPPYREDGLPERTPGEGIAKHLWDLDAAFFLRDLRQLRRRHRLDRILLWLFAVVVVWKGWASPEDPELSSWLLTAWGLFVILGLHGSLATLGPELGSTWMDRMLPVGWGPPRRGNLVASSLYPAVSLLWCVAATLWGGDYTTTLTVLGLGSAAIIGLLVSARWLAERPASGTSQLPAWMWAASWIALVGLTNGAM